MCVINFSSNTQQRLEVSAMYFKFGRIMVFLLNLTLVVIICLVVKELYGVLIFRNGGYTQWSEFTMCSVSCGGGIKTHKRFCTNPEPSIGGKTCESLGPSVEGKKCKERPCPINGGFEQWSEFGTCSASCGGGTKIRVRFCISPVPKYDGLDCKRQNLGPYEEERSCNQHECVVDGGYTNWSEWGKCSVDCGAGKMKRTRTCTNPLPGVKGKLCDHLGVSMETKVCTAECPIDGRYGDWGYWNQCTKGCGGGFHIRTRACDSPVPSNGGKTCIEQHMGNPEDEKPCNTQSCNRNGGYGVWGEWNECSVTCGEGRMERKRDCNNPKPKGKGKSCKEQHLGAHIEADECQLKSC